MKLSLQEKIDRDLPLTKRELVPACGYGIRAINRMNLPFVEGKIRLSDFWAYIEEQIYSPKTVTVVDASPEPSHDLRLLAGKLREPQPSRAQRAASLSLAESPPHNSA